MSIDDRPIRGKRFMELMLKYVVDCNWDALNIAEDQFPNKYAVLVAISFSAVIRMDYVSGPEIEGEICRVEVNQYTTKESLLDDFMTAMGFGSDTLTISS